MPVKKLLLLVAIVLVACGGGGAKAKDATSDASEVQIEYVPIAISWVKHFTKSPPADAARKLGDEMISRMQSSSEPLDSIADAAIGSVLGKAAVTDAKRRKAVTLAASKAGEADLPPDAREALAAFARKAKPGDVVDSPLGSGPVLVVARAAH